MTESVIGNMKLKNWGRIINMSSLAIYGIKHRSVYAAVKSALISLTCTWALELAPYNIRVSALDPGAILTEMFRKMRPVDSIEEKPQEVAAMTALLLSDEGSFITGQTISIDDGASI